MPDRRDFLRTLSAPAVAAATGIPFVPAGLGAEALDLVPTLASHPGAPDDVARDEDFWMEVARAFTVDRSFVNFNNGGVSPAPAFVQAAMKRHLDMSNEAPAYTMWQLQEPRKEGVRLRMARAWGVDSEEIALTRNASEGLQICQMGFDLEPGDEVLTTTQDYPRMIQSFRQREKREGIVMRQIRIPVPAEDPAEVVRLFEAAITDRTRLILACHMINLTGQILPIAEIVALGRRRGIPVICDGAHALAHFDFSLAELECDYYASSLHKWLFAPIGTGMLYVRRERIADLWPLQAPPANLEGDIRKFEEIGTHPAANTLAIAEALTFHEALQPKRKEARLIYLRDRWARRLLEHDRVVLNTSLAPGRACGIANVRVEGIDTAALQRHLWQTHRIYTITIRHEEFEGLRVSPSVYATLDEIDRFADVVEDAIRNGVPA